ncbi:hypothetical protein [Actinomadura napierensis]|uniref:SlyX family protein n=1 Tax=Actinomadura napierensis TaxID=267854 RepID=A0ABN2ZWJ3_9ACTN
MGTAPDRTPSAAADDELLQVVVEQQATINDLVSGMAALQRVVTRLTLRIEALERSSPPIGSNRAASTGPLKDDQDAQET